MPLRSSALHPLLMMQTSVWGISEEYDLAEIVPRRWGPPWTRRKTLTPDFPRLAGGAKGGMLCNISALHSKACSPGGIQNLHSQRATALKNERPGL